MWEVKLKLREIFRLFHQHTVQHNIALALRLTIIRSHLFALQHQQQPQQLTQQLSIAQVQKPIIIRCLLSAQHPPTQVLCIAQAQKAIITRCPSCAQQTLTQLHSTALAARRTIILIHSTALYLLLQLLVVSLVQLHLRLPTPMVSIAVPLANTTIPRLTSALTLLIAP